MRIRKDTTTDLTKKDGELSPKKDFVYSKTVKLKLGFLNKKIKAKAQTSVETND